ncbi:molybdate ABC transporter permease subunit [Ectobacillus panaciterrae]|uniref:molybdate ABC transporter permease subunit n=1 Tax=Ectobacillus panaciterrae TaxID=363872 RepID=UPI00041827BE|nr:molybdate ABC transporter permease subunit [Ectobacillus panaciterrae]
MNQHFFTPIRLSIEVAAMSGLIVILLGTIAGRLMARSEFRGKVFIDTLFLSPMVLPPTVVGFFLIVTFGRNGFIGWAIESVFQQSIMFTWWAAVIASSVVAFPLMYQSAKAGFLQANAAIEDGARDLGANELQVFLYVTLPLAFPSLLSGALLSFVRALGEFGATLMFAGNIPGKTQTMPTAIYMAIDAGNMHLAWAWVLTIVGLSVGFLSLTQVLNRKLSR